MGILLLSVPFVENWSDFHQRGIYILINFTSLEKNNNETTPGTTGV